jgi:thiamine pyrophosphokinase
LALIPVWFRICEDEREKFIPQYIKGDLDSLRPEVGDWYRSRGTEVIGDPDQDTNDLEKCLELVKQGGGGRVGAVQETSVFVLGSLGLRFDHNMANLHMLYKYAGQFGRLVLLGHESVAFLLPAGSHVIRPDPEVEGPVCGLIPLACRCRSITTTGLR